MFIYDPGKNISRWPSWIQHLQKVDFNPNKTNDEHKIFWINLNSFWKITSQVNKGYKILLMYDDCFF